jgi:HD-like signal output (HDOD) protein
VAYQRKTSGGGMSENRPLAYWLEKLTTDNFPILRRSREQLLIMERDINRVTDDDIAKQVYRDPFLMTNLLRRVAKMPRRGLAGEVTTINRAVMMVGMQPFFLWAKNLPVLEDTLRGKTPVLQRLLAVLSCSYHAAHQAWQWALLRKDMNAEEVFVATLLQNRIAWAGWLLIPGEMLVIEQHMRRERFDFAKAFSRHTDYLYEDIQTALAKKWTLPELYCDFLHGHNAIRGQGAVLALKLSDAVQRGWWQPQVTEIIQQIADWLHQPLDELTIKIHQYSVQAARQSEGWYGGATPSAAWLPMLPGEWPDDPLQALLLAAANTPATATAATIKASAVDAPLTKSDVPVTKVDSVKAVKTSVIPPAINTVVVAPQNEAVSAAANTEHEHVLHPDIVSKIIADIKSHMDGSYDIGQLMTRILIAMHDGLAMDRVVFALVNPDQSVKARFAHGVDEGSPMKRLNFNMVEKHLFSQLMTKMQAVWFSPATQQKLAPLLLPKLRAQIGRGEFMAMSIHVHNKPIGFFYADYGDKDHMDENIYNGFKQLCTLAAEGMGHLSKKVRS